MSHRRQAVHDVVICCVCGATFEKLKSHKLSRCQRCREEDRTADLDDRLAIILKLLQDSKNLEEKEAWQKAYRLSVERGDFYRR